MQHEQDPAQRLPVRHPRPALHQLRSRLGQQRLDQRPQFIRHDPRPRLSLSHDQTNDHPSRKSLDQQLLLGPLKATFARTSWHHRPLRGASQAGLITNLNDGLTWGVFPLLFTDHGLGLAAVGLIKGLYPILWGLGQIPTGHLVDRIGRKPLIAYGMLVQAVGFVLALALLDRPLFAGVLSAVFPGLGTAMVYPALIASISDHAHPA
ncbi:MFS transporter [Streptomyces qaidamensis]|uniref:MFS transporter n=1 Tax=Streptomyces qaidamensis TaxID=1783515 RepID=UPI001F02A2C7|nr:MFS transporter [Streptomyces qaidamensis]